MSRSSLLLRLVVLLGAAAGSLPQVALADPSDWLYDYDRNAPPPGRLQPPPAVRGRWAYSPAAPDAPGAVLPPDPAQAAAQMAGRCNVGRLVGGLVGGGIGYAASRKDGRSWAVPLGALLGQQMGCSIGAGRGPRPW